MSLCDAPLPSRRPHPRDSRLRLRTRLLLLLSLLAACATRTWVPSAWQGPPADDARRTSGAGTVRTCNRGYDRARSPLLARCIARATRANLDYAAYHANVMLYDPGPEHPRLKGAVVPPAEQLFGGFVDAVSLVGSLAATPLTDQERSEPMAFSPMVDFLARHSPEEAVGLEDARAAVSTETWGLPRNVQTVYQRLADAYLHHPGGGEDAQLWVRIEFPPWARLFEGMSDDDGDGFFDLYGRLRDGLLSTAALAHLQRAYRGEPLDREQVRAWAHELASYWYPSFNTDVVYVAGEQAWPPGHVDRKVARAIDGVLPELRIRSAAVAPTPTVVLQGKPHGKPLYFLLVDEGAEHSVSSPAGKPPQPASATTPLEEPRGPVTPRTQPVAERVRRELSAEGGGSWQAWARSVAPLHEAIRARLQTEPARVMALPGSDGFIFYRKSLAYVAGGDLRAQPAGKDPVPALVELRRYLADLGIDFLLVLVPTKVEIYPDRAFPQQTARLTSSTDTTAPVPVINPYARKLVAELAEQHVEVVDLLPVFLRARADDPAADELVYQPQDTHWTSRGLKLAAAAVAARVRQYPWLEGLAKHATPLSIRRGELRHHGDLVSRLPEQTRGRYAPQTLRCDPVLRADGSPYEDEPASPILLLGDSFTGVYQRTHCRNAGVSAHLARLLSQPVDLVMSYGGGPGVRRKLMRRGVESLRQKRLVIWMLASRDLYDCWEDWDLLF